MNATIHRADSRGHANHGWLNTHHTFSFAGYHHPERTHFGALRVLNDDEVAPGKGFGRHGHDNMEIISIPLEGDLEHKDSMGTVSVIRRGDVQAMSAGSGIFHSEYNRNDDLEVKFLQIWVFPKLRNIAPRYDQKSYSPEDRKNKIQRIVSPIEDGSDTVKIVQDAYFSLSDIDGGAAVTYQLNRKESGVYIFVLEGEVSIGDYTLYRRDGIAITNADTLDIVAKNKAEVLIMEVPMN